MVTVLLSCIWLVARRDISAQGDDSAWQALSEIVKMDYWACLSSAELASQPLLRDEVARLVALLRDPDERVRGAAFNLLSAKTRDGPKASDMPERWEEWLRNLRATLGVQYPMRMREDYPTLDEVLLDILQVRTRYPFRNTIEVLGERPSHEAISRMVNYLRHPDRRVRESAASTLTPLKQVRPGGLDEPELWEAWLRRLERQLALPEVIHRPRNSTEFKASSQSAETALMQMLSIHGQFWWRNDLGKKATISGLMMSHYYRNKVGVLVRLLSHSDKRVRQAAFNFLTAVFSAVQLEPPAGIDDVQAWESWLDSNEKAYPLVASQVWIVKEDAQPKEDVLWDIVATRTRIARRVKRELIDNPVSREAIRRLATYLSHPELVCRVAADVTLHHMISFGPDERRPKSDRKDWERWLQAMESERR
jgi:hypothetical protein